MASAELSFPYRLWIKTTEGTSLAEVYSSADNSALQPRFLVILHGKDGHTAEQIERSVRSVERQIYRQWELKTDPFLELATAISATDADYLIALRIGDVLAESALMRFAEATVNNPTPAILYGDEDERDTHGRRRRPWFKPSWNSEMFLALDFVSTVAAVRIDIARKFLPTPRNLTQLLLEVSSQQGPIIHLPHVLCHTFFRHGNSEERLLEVRRHLRKFGATCRLGPFDTIKVEWPLPDILPLVSIMIPTKDKANLLRACVESVLVRTEYANFEILIIDNGSVEPSTKRYFDEIAENPRVRIISYAGSFNFSAMNNFAAQHSLGDYLCLLNNDTEILERTWLTEMMRYAVRSEVGAVGAKLLYEDGSIQHAGVVVGIGGVAGHAHRHLPSGSPGYFRQPHVSQFVSAVTAACLVVKKSKFTEVGGLDELELPVAFNDVDFCLKLQAAGYRNVYVPHAVLVHHESKSRGSDSSRRNVARFRREVRVLQERWGTGTYADPLHHPHLERGMETYIVRL